MSKEMVVGPVLTLDWLEKRKNIMGEMDRQLIQGLQNPGTGLTLDQLQLVTEHCDPFELEIKGTPPAVPTYPAVGEVFELTLDGDAPENQPLQIVKDCGYTGKWRHNGRTVKGKQARRFKLAQAGYCRDLDEVRQKLGPDNVHEGQWIMAFKAAYPQPDGNGPVGIADSSWVDPGGRANFPIIRADGDLRFYWAGFDHGADCRWFVAVK